MIFAPVFFVKAFKNSNSDIVDSLNSKYLNQVIDVLIEGEHEETELLISGRHAGQAPDVDGKVIITDANGVNLSVGDMVKVEVTEVLDFDLVGKVLPNAWVSFGPNLKFKLE